MSVTLSSWTALSLGQHLLLCNSALVWRCLSLAAPRIPPPHAFSISMSISLLWRSISTTSETNVAMSVDRKIMQPVFLSLFIKNTASAASSLLTGRTPQHSMASGLMQQHATLTDAPTHKSTMCNFHTLVKYPKSLPL